MPVEMFSIKFECFLIRVFTMSDENFTLLVIFSPQAAGHVHRFRSLDENVIRMGAETNEGIVICIYSFLFL